MNNMLWSEIALKYYWIFCVSPYTQVLQTPDELHRNQALEAEDKTEKTCIPQNMMFSYLQKR